MPRASTAAWLDDVRAGTAAAVVSIGTLLPLGLLAVAALGPAAAGAGLRATFVSAIVGAAVACVVGGARVPFYQPRTSVTLIHAGLVAALAADPALVRDGAPDVALILAVAGVAVMLSGVLQVAFGAFRVGSLAKFVPMPVIAGFMDGVAILIALAQVPLLLGVGTWHAARDLGSATSHLFPAAAVVGLAVVAVSWLVARHRPRWPAALLGMAVGTLLYFGIDALTDAAALGPLIGAPAGGVFRLEALAALTGDAAAAALAAHWRVIVTTAVVLALVGSLDGLLAAMAVDHAHGTRHEPNRLLVGHGSSNLVAGALGGLPLAFSAMGALAIARAGGRTRAAVVVSIVILWLVSTLGAPALGAIPVAVTAGIMLFVALGLGHQWSRFLWRQLRAGSRDRDAVWSFAVVTVVAATTVVFGFVVGIVVGIVLSVALFVVAMNRSLIHAVATGEARTSRRLYPPAIAERLREGAAAIRVVDLAGAVFFGTAERLRREVEAHARGARCVVLDLHRVTTIDASGAMALDALAHHLRQHDVRLLLAGIAAGGRHARALAAYGAFARGEAPAYFPDADRALEFAEGEVLAVAGAPASDSEWPLESLPLARDLTPVQLAALRGRVERRELAAGAVLFREGEPGDRLYALARGSVSMLTHVRGDVSAARRLASFAPGVIFGEAAMLDGGGRTATGVADTASVVYVLTRAALDEVRRDDPALASQLLLNLAREASARLRSAAATIRATDH